MEYAGYAGNILYVNLSTGELRKEPMDPDIAKKFIGGCGINYKLAYDIIKPGTDPFSPDNPIIIGAGPMVGTFAPGSAKIGATTKFALPATPDGRHYITTAMSGSREFGYMLKKTGLDHVVITGQANEPVYLKISDDDVEICDARFLWGKKDIYETTDDIRNKYGKCGVIAIGKAGENLCRFSMALTDKKSTLGRSGFGAVMGSKNLKAIVAKGSREIRVADKSRFKKAVDTIRQRFETQIKPLGNFTKASWRPMFIQNMDPGVWSKYDWDALYGANKWEVIRENVACTSCWIACGGSFKIKEGKFAGVRSQTGLYIWVPIVGQKLELSDHRAAIKLLEQMNRAGICAVTSSSLIDWITRRYSQKIITKKDTDGMILKRDLNTYMDFLDKIINRQGFGDTLAEGWFEASKWVGRDARSDYEEGSGIAKGTDCIYPARAAKLDPMRFTMGISNPRGGHSCLAGSSTGIPLLPLEYIKMDAEGLSTPRDAIDRIFRPAPYYGAFNTARLTRHMEDFNISLNCLGICEIWSGFQLVNAKSICELYSAVTGIEMEPQELKMIGERVFNLYKLLNVKEGFSRADDAFPEVWLKPLTTPDGVQVLTDYYRMHAITSEDLHQLLDDYYDERGWNITQGIPTKEKLMQLGLE